jgi:hypothetical protein
VDEGVAVSDVDELVAFLTRCLDEDERVARCVFRSRIRADGSQVMSIDPPDCPEILVAQVINAPTAEHIARWSCQRVLVEAEVKRRILGLHHPIDPCDAHGAAQETIPCDTLLALAQPYAGQDGWREEWQLSAGA